MSEALSKEQIVSMLKFKLLSHEDVWNMYKDNKISLDEYCYCLTEWKKEGGI